MPFDDRQTPPPIDKDAAARIETFLMQTYDMKRPPVVAAALLALILKLHETRAPFPPRRTVSDRIGCSIFGVDAALSVALSRGLIRQTTATENGRVSARDSIVRVRFYVPTQRLLFAAAATRAA